MTQDGINLLRAVFGQLTGEEFLEAEGVKKLKRGRGLPERYGLLARRKEKAL